MQRSGCHRCSALLRQARGPHRGPSATEVGGSDSLSFLCPCLSFVQEPHHRPPVHHRDLAHYHGTEISLFERLSEAGVAMETLSEQFRMHEDMSWCVSFSLSQLAPTHHRRQEKVNFLCPVKGRVSFQRVHRSCCLFSIPFPAAHHLWESVFVSLLFLNPPLAHPFLPPLPSLSYSLPLLIFLFCLSPHFVCPPSFLFCLPVETCGHAASCTRATHSIGIIFLRAVRTACFLPSGESEGTSTGWTTNRRKSGVNSGRAAGLDLFPPPSHFCLLGLSGPWSPWSKERGNALAG